MGARPTRRSSRPARPPRFGELTLGQCRAMLRRHRVGRLAYTFRDRVDVEPISYVYSAGGVAFRTSPGSKLETLAHHPWVALEIDEVDGPFDWRSVVVHGTAYVLRKTSNPADSRAYAAAVKALRRLLPETLRREDPVPFRWVVLRLNVDRLTGRFARSSAP
jgi:nitroimidazol reductase NimA-like FMN-containing flavoprotein (pyridoxamine 5'-phosphate oxidase superfamily)